VRIGGSGRPPSGSGQPSGGNIDAYRNSMTENIWGNIGFVIGVSVVACIPAMIFGVVLGGRILSNIPGFIIAAILAAGSFYLVRSQPRTALLFPVSITAFFLLGWLVSGSDKPSPKELSITKKEGRRHEALLQGKAVGQCKDMWERGITTAGVRDAFRQSWWDAASKPAVDQFATTLNQLATNVENCLENNPPGISLLQPALTFDADLGLFPIQLGDIKTTIDISRKAIALAQRKNSGAVTPDDLLMLSRHVSRMDSIGRDPLSTPNTRIGKIPGTGLGM
jgi:hypothetical protein